MKQWINKQEWEELLREHPELAQDLEDFFRDKKGSVTSVVGFYSILKMRIWNFLSFQKGKPLSGEAQADEALPPHSSGANG